MAKIDRATASIFGESAGFEETAEFGSLAAGSPVFVAPGSATAVEQMQSLGAWTGGWSDAVIGGNSPAIEDMNALCYVLAYQIAYALQAGIAEYDAQTPYYKGSMVNIPIVIFTVTSANATVGATYTNNGATFTVLQTIAAGTRLVCYAATGAPAASGTLTKDSGTGDATITFASNTLNTSIYGAITDANTGQAITDSTKWLPVMPAVGKPWQRLAADSAGAANAYTYNSFNSQSADENLTVAAGMNLCTGFLTVETGVTYSVAGSVVCGGTLTVNGTVTVSGSGVVLVN